MNKQGSNYKLLPFLIKLIFKNYYAGNTIDKYVMHLYGVRTQYRLAGETRFEHATYGFGDRYSTVEPLP